MFISDGASALFDSLRPEVPLLAGLDLRFGGPAASFPNQPLLVIESTEWSADSDVGPRLLLLGEAGAGRVTAREIGESGAALSLSPARTLVWVDDAEEGTPRFQPTQLVLGPEGHLWIVDPGSGSLWRLRPEGSSTRLGPVLGSADEAELFLALRHPNGERRRVAEDLLLAHRVPLHAQDRGLALLESYQQNSLPLAAASMDRVMARRGAALPRSKPMLDGGRREALERHQVRLDTLRVDPLAARRLLPRWLECTPRTRLIIAQVLATHPGATSDEEDLGRAVLAVPESFTRYVVLLDGVQARDPRGDASAQLSARYLDALAPLGVEYVEVVHSICDLLPRLDGTHTLILSSQAARYSAPWPELIEAHLSRGGGLVVMASYQEKRNTDAGSSWLHGLASMAGGVEEAARDVARDARFIDVPTGMEQLAEDLGNFPCRWTFAVRAPSLPGSPESLNIPVQLGEKGAVVGLRDSASGCIVTFAPPLADSAVGGAGLPIQRLLRAFVLRAGAGRIPRKR